MSSEDLPGLHRDGGSRAPDDARPERLRRELRILSRPEQSPGAIGRGRETSLHFDVQPAGRESPRRRIDVAGRADQGKRLP